MMGRNVRAWCRATGVQHIFLVIWLFACSMLFWMTYNYFKYNLDFYYVHQILGSFLCISRGTATVLNLNCGLVLLPVCPSLRTLLRRCNKQISLEAMRIILDSCKGFHIACAISIFTASAIHATGHLFNARNFSRYYTKIHQGVNGARFLDEDPIWIVLRTIPGVSGLLLMVLLILVVTSSSHYMRDVNYDLFYISHRLVIVFYVLLLIHGLRGPIMRQTNVSLHTPGCNATNTSMAEPVPFPEAEYHVDVYVCEEEPKFNSVGCESWMWIGIPLLIYSCDMIYRLVRRTATTSVSAITLFPGDMIKLCMRQHGFRAQPGQYVLVNCPGVSILEWHPFSLTMCPSETSEDFAVVIQAYGDWSGKVKRILSLSDEKETEDQIEPLVTKIPPNLSVIIDGPFSSALEGVLRQKVVLCIAGGIGITPFLSVLGVLKNIRSHCIPLQRMYLVCVNKNLVNVLYFIDDIVDTHTVLWNNNHPDLLEVQFHFTQITNLDWDKSESIPETTLGFVHQRAKLKRPEWTSIFEDLCSRHQRDDVNVYACGSQGLTCSIRDICMKASTRLTQFIFHKETF